jgi:hypothetical protein
MLSRTIQLLGSAFRSSQFSGCFIPTFKQPLKATLNNSNQKILECSEEFRYHYRLTTKLSEWDNIEKLLTSNSIIINTQYYVKNNHKFIKCIMTNNTDDQLSAIVCEDEKMVFSVNPWCQGHMGGVVSDDEMIVFSDNPWILSGVANHIELLH